MVTRELENPNIWNDPQRAQDLGREKKQLDQVVGTLTALDQGLDDSSGLFDLARTEDDDATLVAIRGDVAKLE